MAGLFEPVVTLHQTFSPMKKTRLLGYLLAAAACALSIPACGGGGDDSGNTYISVSQFVAGGKAFKIFGSPSMRVFAFSRGVEMREGQANGILNGTGYGPATPDTQPSPEGEYEGRMNLEGYIQFDDSVGARATLSYGTYGGEAGMGVLEILPQEGFDQSNGDLTRKMIHFLGGVSPADVQTGTSSSGATMVIEDGVYLRYLLFSLAGCSYRVVIDFAAGTMEFFLNYSAEWRVPVTDSSGNVIPNVYVEYRDIIDALNLNKHFVAEPR